jgi:hypothetical protein
MVTAGLGLSFAYHLRSSLDVIYKADVARVELFQTFASGDIGLFLFMTWQGILGWY